MTPKNANFLTWMILRDCVNTTVMLTRGVPLLYVLCIFDVVGQKQKLKCVRTSLDYKVSCIDWDIIKHKFKFSAMVEHQVLFK